MRDSFGREISYLRVSVTDRCNLRCVYCMPPEGVRLLRHEDILSFERITSVVRAAAGLGFKKIRLTGGEPLVRRDFPRLVTLLAGVPGIEELVMTTNGTLLAPVAAELARRGLHSVNVSLDTMDTERYATLTRGGRLVDALCGIEAAVGAGLAVKLNVVVFGSESEADVEGVRAYAARVGAKVQLISKYRLDEPKREAGGCDRPPRCETCTRLRLLADGRLRPCLRGAATVAVDFDDLEGSIRRAVLAKPERGLSCADLEVGQIGG